MAVNRVRLRISDPVKPVIGFTGAFGDNEVVRGTQVLGPSRATPGRAWRA